MLCNRIFSGPVHNKGFPACTVLTYSPHSVLAALRKTRWSDIFGTRTSCLNILQQNPTHSGTVNTISVYIFVYFSDTVECQADASKFFGLMYATVSTNVRGYFYSRAAHLSPALERTPPSGITFGSVVVQPTKSSFHFGSTRSLPSEFPVVT